MKCTSGGCEHCSTTSWIGPQCEKIPKPYPDYAASGCHYTKVENTPVEIDGKVGEIDDFKPRKQAFIESKEHRLETRMKLRDFVLTSLLRKGS